MVSARAHDADAIRKIQRGELPPPAIAILIGFHPVSIDPGVAVFEMHAGPRHASPMGTVHGGVLCRCGRAGSPRPAA